MEITTKRENHWIEFFPNISLSWWKYDYTLYIGWLMWNVVIKINRK